MSNKSSIIHIARLIQIPGQLVGRNVGAHSAYDFEAVA